VRSISDIHHTDPVGESADKRVRTKAFELGIVRLLVEVHEKNEIGERRVRFENMRSDPVLRHQIFVEAALSNVPQVRFDCCQRYLHEWPRPRPAARRRGTVVIVLTRSTGVQGRGNEAQPCPNRDPARMNYGYEGRTASPSMSLH